MPSIDLTRLNQQVEDLARVFPDPAAFIKAFHDLLGFYHRYAHRRQKDAIPFTFLPAYDLPPQLMPQLELYLRPTATRDPSTTLGLVDALWQQDHYEDRELAAFLLGQLSGPNENAVYARLGEWIKQPQDRALLAALLTKAGQASRAANPQGWKQFLLSLLENPGHHSKAAGLLGLADWVPLASSDDYPVILTRMRLFLQDPGELLQDQLERLVAGLAKRNPKETAYLLKEVLSDTPGPAIEQRIRGYLQYFPESNAESIQASLRAHR